MTMALTKVRAFAVEADSPVTKRYLQYLELTITGANTDVDYDFGDHVAGSLGTFWEAVDGSEPGDTGLEAIRDIAAKADAFLWIEGTGLSTRQMVDASRTTIVSIDSAASAGGAAAETYTVTGLLTTDDIKSVCQFQKGANAAYIVDFGGATGQAAANNALVVEYNTDVGAGAKVRVTVARASTTPEAGTYARALGTLAPNITFASGDAPTAMKVTLCWALKDGMAPTTVTATSGAQTSY